MTKGYAGARRQLTTAARNRRAPGYGYEACNAQHDYTVFEEDSETVHDLLVR